MNKNYIKIINEWNPIEIHPLLENEYSYEIKRIFQGEGMDNEKLLATKIYSVFKDSFGDIFNKTIEECEVIAKELLTIKH